MSAGVVVALDIDGVLNHDSGGRARRRGGEPPQYFPHAQIGGYYVQWRWDVVDALREVLTTPGVRGAWLTTWLAHAELLAEFEQAIGYDDLGLLRAPYPTAGREAELGFAPTTSHAPATSRWWKYRSAELLVEQTGAERLCWVDDDLGRARGPGVWGWRPGERDGRLLIRPDSTAGLLGVDVRRVREWVGRGKWRAR